VPLLPRRVDGHTGRVGGPTILKGLEGLMPRTCGIGSTGDVEASFVDSVPNRRSSMGQQCLACGRGVLQPMSWASPTIASDS
jgi:hypothetical protein